MFFLKAHAGQHPIQTRDGDCDCRGAGMAGRDAPGLACVSVSCEPWEWHAGGCKSEGAAAEGEIGLNILKNHGKSLLNSSFLHCGLLNQSRNPTEE